MRSAHVLIAVISLCACGPTHPLPNAASLQDAAMDATADAAANDAQSSSDSGRVMATRADRPRECPATMPIADTYNWAPPHVRRGSCTTEQVQQLAAAIQTTPINEATYRAMLGDRCYECAISDPEMDATWGAVLRQSASNIFSYGNVGGCMVAAGASLPCGIAANNYGRCAFAACDGCGVTDLRACTADPAIYAAGGPCSAARVAYQRACANTNTQFQRCYGPDGISEQDWIALIATELCGPSPDAGM
ncbi:MAG: hypothetical protein U0269_25965 [Polyangiales bacterium]